MPVIIGRPFRQSSQVLQTITWTDLVNAVDSGGGTLTATAGAGWTAAGFSNESFTGDGYVEFTAIGGKTRILGINTANSGTILDIPYGIYAHISGTLYKFEVPSFTVIDTWTNGDILRVEVSGSNILYKKNGVVVSTSGNAFPAAPRYADAALYDAGAAVELAVIEQL
jgi:hypothetical protein